MKNIYNLLIVLFVLVSSTELTKAQSSFAKPYPGSTHTYEFDNIDPASSTTWYISRDATFDATALSFADPNDSEFTLSTLDGLTVADAAGNLTGTAISKVKIFWTGKAVGTYYLFVNVSKDGCSNLKGYQINVLDGEFNAIVADVTGATIVDPNDPAYDDSEITTNTCPDQTTMSPIVELVPDTYSLGTSTIKFRVNREFTNTTNGWQIAFASLGSEASITKVEDDTDVITADGSGFYQVDGDKDYVIITVTVNNALSTADVSLTLDKDNTIDLVTLVKDTGAGDSATHTFNTLPTIGNISGS